MSSLPEDLDRLLHDLRGPLSGALTNLELLRLLISDGEVPPAATVEHGRHGTRPTPGCIACAQQTRERAHEELLRLKTLMMAAFEVVALERGELAIVDLRDVVERALKEHDVGGAVLAEGRWPRVRIDERLVGLAVAHLVRNALQSTAATGVARPPRVSATPAGPAQVALTVRDWGAGLRSTNPKILVRLRGVGLVTAERVARLHGGVLSFGSPGEGAEVTLTLPAA
jgi:signal transduction histidine kinase